jgi:hypothetical protein
LHHYNETLVSFSVRILSGTPPCVITAVATGEVVMPSYGQAPAPEKKPTASSGSESLQAGFTQPGGSTQPTFYSQQMAKHGLFYWFLHAAVALGVAIAGAAVWDSFLSKIF